MVLMALLGSLIGGFTATLMKTCTLKHDIDGHFTLGLVALIALALAVAVA